MRLVAVLCAAVAVAAVALASSRAAVAPKSSAPSRTYLRPLGGKTKTLASCRQWLYGSVAKGSSIEICTWDARRNVASIRAVADSATSRRR